MPNTSILDALVSATRPFKPFTFTAGDHDFSFFCRRLSAAESAVINQVYNDEFNTTIEELENESPDLAAMKRTFERQKKDRLVDYILMMNMNDYLSEASSELDDLPYSDPRVKARAEIVKNKEKSLMMGAPDAEIVELALEKRAYVYAAVKASTKRNIQIIYYSVYTKEDKEARAFGSTEDIANCLDSATIDSLLTELAKALGEEKADPLQLVEKTSSKRRIKSVKPLVEA